MNKEAMLKETYNSAFEDELEKIGVGPKTITKGVKAVFKRSGQKFDSSKLNYHGLESLNKSKLLKDYGPNSESLIKEFRNNAAYRLATMQELFP